MQCKQNTIVNHDGDGDKRKNSLNIVMQSISCVANTLHKYARAHMYF